MTKSGVPINDFSGQVMKNTNQDIYDKTNKKKYVDEQQRMAFVRALLECRKSIEMGEKITNNVRAYKITNRLRKILGISGKTCDLIPQEFIKSHKYIPECLFEPNTKDERLKEIERVNELLKDAHDLKSFEKLNE